MLGIPLVLGLAETGFRSGAAIMIVPAIFLAFMARYAAVPAIAKRIARRTPTSEFLARHLLWGAIYLAACLACLAAAYRLAEPVSGNSLLGAAAATLALGGGHSVLTLVGRDRSLAGEIVGMAGLSSTIPLLVAVAGRPVGGRAIGLAILCLAYFASTATFVRAFGRSGGRRSIGAATCVGTHLVLAALLIGLCVAGRLPAAALAAFVPALARTAWGIVAPPGSIRDLGRREAAVAATFLLIALVAILAESGS